MPVDRFQVSKTAKGKLTLWPPAAFARRVLNDCHGAKLETRIWLELVIVLTGPKLSVTL